MELSTCKFVSVLCVCKCVLVHILSHMYLYVCMCIISFINKHNLHVQIVLFANLNTICHTKSHSSAVAG